LVVCPSDSINYKFGDYQYQPTEIEKSRRFYFKKFNVFCSTYHKCTISN
jgi:hypothetical protein